MVVLAQDEARALGHSYIGTEHELLGLLFGGNDIVAKALAGVTVEMVRDHAPARSTSPATGQIPFTPGAKAVLERAVDEADARNHGLIGTEHLLLGLLGVDDTATAILRDCGVDLKDVRRAVVDAIGDPRLP